MASDFAKQKLPKYVIYIQEVIDGKKPLSQLTTIAKGLTAQLADNMDNHLMLLELAQFLSDSGKPGIPGVEAAFRAHIMLKPHDEPGAQRALQLWEKAFDQLPDVISKLAVLERAQDYIDAATLPKRGTIERAFLEKLNAIPQSKAKDEMLRKGVGRNDNLEEVLEARAKLTEKEIARNILVKYPAPKPPSHEISVFIEKFREWAERQKTLQHGRG